MRFNLERLNRHTNIYIIGRTEVENDLVIFIEPQNEYFNENSNSKFFALFQNFHLV